MRSDIPWCERIMKSVDIAWNTEADFIFHCLIWVWAKLVRHCLELNGCFERGNKRVQSFKEEGGGGGQKQLFVCGYGEITLGGEIRIHWATRVVTNDMWHLGIRAVSSQGA